MLKLWWVRHHLAHVLKFLHTNDPTLSLLEVHRRLEHSHQLLITLQRGHAPKPWERWSVIQFHFRKPEVLSHIQTARDHLQGPVGPEQLHMAQQALLVLHLIMVDPSASLN